MYEEKGRIMLNFLRNIFLGGCFHDWGKWEKCTITLHEDGHKLGTVSGQLRTCKKCGKEKISKT